MVQPVGQQRKDQLLMVTQEHQKLIDTAIGQFRDSFIVHLVRQAGSSQGSQVLVEGSLVLVYYSQVLFKGSQVLVIDIQVITVAVVQVSRREFFQASQ